MRTFISRVPWKNSGIDTEWPEHDSYLSDFQDVATSTIQSLINKSIEQKPEINAKTKQTQVMNGVYYLVKLYCRYNINIKTFGKHQWVVRVVYVVNLLILFRAKLKICVQFLVIELEGPSTNIVFKIKRML